MHLLMRRYHRSGAAPAWFYGAAAAGFGALFVWAVVAGDWLVAVVALLMAPLTLIGARFLRRPGAAPRLEDEHG
jgi:uncharacterized membrane protein